MVFLSFLLIYCIVSLIVVFKFIKLFSFFLIWVFVLCLGILSNGLFFGSFIY